MASSRAASGSGTRASCAATVSPAPEPRTAAASTSASVAGSRPRQRSATRTRNERGAGGGASLAQSRPGNSCRSARACSGLPPVTECRVRAARVAAAVATKGLPGQAGAAARQGETHRLLAMVPPEGIQRAEARQEDKVNVWPHLLLREAVAAFAMFAFVTVFSMVVNAPLRELANSNLTPNPSKAPWYFLGLQELLRYFHPMVAGVTIPGIALLILMATPYFDRNPSMRPENRKLAILMFTMFMMFWAILVLAGSFFRGPSFEWVWPWTETCSTPIHPDKTCLFFEF